MLSGAGQGVEELWLKAWYVWLLKFLRRVKLCGMAASSLACSRDGAALRYGGSRDYRFTGFSSSYYHQLCRYSSGHERPLISWNTPLSRSYVSLSITAASCALSCFAVIKNEGICILDVRNIPPRVKDDGKAAPRAFVPLIRARASVLSLFLLPNPCKS